MVSKAREFIDFWIKNSVHARPELGLAGGSQDAAELAQRLLMAAKEQGFSSEELASEIGDPAEYLRSKLDRLNVAETKRRQGPK